MITFTLLALVFAEEAVGVYYPGVSNAACLTYADGNKWSSATLYKEAVECVGVESQFIGFYCNYKACAHAVKELGGKVFKWGGDGSGKFTKDRKYRKSKAGWTTTAECWMENIADLSGCPTVKDGQYDLYHINDQPNDAKATLIKQNVECNSGDTRFQGSASGGVLECRNAVKKAGGKFFVFGNPRSGKELNCWWEHTSSASCPEGWENDSYGFWEVKEGSVAPPSAYTCRGKCYNGYCCHSASGQCRRCSAMNTAMTTCVGACGGGTCCNKAETKCMKCGSEEAIGLNLFKMPTSPADNGPGFAVNGLAVVGFTAMLYGAVRFYMTK